MPLFGVRDVAPMLDGVAVMESLRTEPLELPGADVLHLMLEIDDGGMQSLLPKALHPTIPPTVTFVFWRCVEGPLGPFTLAQVRAGCRAGVRPRGFLLASYCDAEPAAESLRARWGFDCRPGMVRLRRHYDRITGSVVVADREVLRVSLADPQAISGADVQYVASMHLARVPSSPGSGGTDQPGTQNPELATRLVQVDPEFTIRRADRGRPVVEVFAPDAWNAQGLTPVYPVSGTFCTVDLTLPHIRYMMDPDVPAMQGTQTVPA